MKNSVQSLNESQRDSANQPGVARHDLPRVNGKQIFSTLKGLSLRRFATKAATPSGLKIFLRLTRGSSASPNNPGLIDKTPLGFGKRRICTNNSPAFTLIEVVISAALMALILVSAYLCLSAGIAGKRMVEPRADIFQNARVTLALLSADLHGACVLPGDSAFLGMKRMIGDVEADNLDFATHNYTPRHANEGDFCEESYYVEKDPRSGRFSLWRRRNPTLAPEPLQGGKQEPIASDILGLQLEYSDGTDWYENWGEVKGAAKAQNSQSDSSNLSGLPNAVRITLLLDSDPDSKPEPHTGERKIEPPLAFTTVAFLNLAEAARDAANTTSSSSQSSSDQSPTTTQNGGSQ
jgi:type II secretory pathway component PulJ